MADVTEHYLFMSQCISDLRAEIRELKQKLADEQRAEIADRRWLTYRQLMEEREAALQRAEARVAALEAAGRKMRDTLRAVLRWDLAHEDITPLDTRQSIELEQLIVDVDALLAQADAGKPSDPYPNIPVYPQFTEAMLREQAEKKQRANQAIQSWLDDPDGRYQDKQAHDALMKCAGTWKGDDFEECLAAVKGSESRSACCDAPVTRHRKIVAIPPEYLTCDRCEKLCDLATPEPSDGALDSASDRREGER